MERFSQASEENYALANEQIGAIARNMRETTKAIAALGQVWAAEPGHQQIWGALVRWHAETTIGFHEATIGNGLVPTQLDQHAASFAYLAKSAASCAADDTVRMSLLARWDQVEALAAELAALDV